MAIDFGRMFRNVATGYLSAKIANTEANDKLNARIIEAAGIKFHEKTYPEWEKKQELYEKDYKMVEAIHGKQVANYFGEKGLFGTGSGLNDVESILTKYNISKGELNKLDLSTFEERKASRLEEIQNKEKTIMGLTSGSSKIGNMTAELLLQDDKVMTDAGTGTGTATETQPSNVEGTPIVPVQPDISTSVSTDLPESIFTKKADPVGVETKFNSISRAVNEQMGYGEPIYRADGSVTFNIANDLKTTSNAHIALASSITQQRDDISQIDAVSLAEQELFKQTVTPFNIIASSIKGANYSAGSGKKPALIEGMGGQKIDAETTMIGDKSVYDFIAEIYNNELLKDGGRVNRHVFKKFIENLPTNIIYKGEKLSDVLAINHDLQYFRNY